MSPPASWAPAGNNRRWRPAAAWSSPRASTRPTSRWPPSTASTRCGVSATSGGISCGPGPLTPRRSATGAMRGPNGSRCCTGRTTRWPPPSPAPAPTRTPPAAGKVIATLNNEWDGLARHQDLPQLPLDNNRAERALRTPVIGRKNFYGSGAQWAAHLAADVWTITATAARHDIEPLTLLTSYLHACAQGGGTAPAGAGLDPFLPWTPQGRARRRPASDQRRGPGP